MSHYQLSNFAIYGLEHSETDMNSEYICSCLFEYVFQVILCK